jgi:NADPH:quinone reductase-like Zn-dependent oxidoreductase
MSPEPQVATADESTNRPRPPSMMAAVTRLRYGGTDVVHLDQIACPSISDDEVLLEVHAAGVDRGVWHVMTGLPYAIRVAGFGLRAPNNPVLGSEVSGRVVATGKGVTGLQVGDEVFGIAEGSFADYARARADKLASKPASISFVQAAATTLSALTALQGVRDHGRVDVGQTVLVTGASGGVGSFAVQIAKSRGAVVTGVASTGKLDLVRSLGADDVIDYTCDGITASGRRFDVILDIAGNQPIRRLRRALKPHGRLIIQGGETGGRWLGGSDRQLRAIALSPFIKQKLGTFICSENAADLRDLAEFLATGQIRPAVDRTFALRETAAAIDYLVAGKTRGKVVIDVRGGSHV